MGGFEDGARLQVTEVDHESFMRLALHLAVNAQALGEVPVGAVVVLDGVIVGTGCNSPISSGDPTAHAEILAIRAAALQVGNYRLTGASLYVTLEPCVMCAGALVTARIGRLCFAARDLRFGAVRSKFRLADSSLLNHQTAVIEGPLQAEAAELMATFFRTRRSLPSS